MTAYRTPRGRKYGDPRKWFIYKSRWSGQWHILPPTNTYRASRKREATFDAARNYLIEQLKGTT